MMPVGRDHVDVVGQDRHRVRDLHHLVGRARLVGRQVQDHHQRHAGAGRHVLQQRPQRRVTAGRGTDADDGERQAAPGDGWRICCDLFL